MTPTPTLAHTRQELREALRVSAVRRVRDESTATEQAQVGLVPTMGALHDGHASLMRTARRNVDAGSAVVVSIFVNPMQFALGEDLTRYPRTLDADLDRCAAEGVDVVFAPSVDEVYPGGEPQVSVDPGPMAGLLEGASRPTHFHGVLTVVAKLLGLVRPDVAVFGEKDYQQLALIRRMSSDLCLGVDVVGAPTVREADGLALSSRNHYLDTDARQAATALSRALFAGRAAAPGGPGDVLSAARVVLRGARGVEPDYVELTAPDLGPAPDRGEARLLVAARVGGTRLIDNVALFLGPEHLGGDS